MPLCNLLATLELRCEELLSIGVLSAWKEAGDSLRSDEFPASINTR
jgi:hypothetical protein